jgi:formylglycine-generating enzyme required for sulfatase activity
MESSENLDEVTRLPPYEQLESVTKLLSQPDKVSYKLKSIAVNLINMGVGSASQRMRLGEVLGQNGDPRLLKPEDANYWVSFDLDEWSIQVGRFMVTTEEWTAFVNSQHYGNDDIWSTEGLEWRNSKRPSWQKLASSPNSISLIIPNQPVVGVSWYEAEAYARFCSARLPSFLERENIVRGREKRPYPWGKPFGHDNANTLEEGLSKPCAVGLFLSDQTPEGIFDLAANVAEWTSDQDGNKRVIHPGSYNQPAMAAWAKASHLISAAARTAELGFRIVRDI